MRGVWMRLWNWARRVRSPKSGRVATGQKAVSIEWDENGAAVGRFQEKVREYGHHGLL